ncbi:MAG: hypothetical protein ACJ74H_22995 [Thermoanaerobaculia bacterium]
MAQILLKGSDMALRNDDLPPHLRRAPAERPQLPVEPPQDRDAPQERNTRTPQNDRPPARDPYLRRNAGIASPPPYERN